jgi:hypothetical protein
MENAKCRKIMSRTSAFLIQNQKGKPGFWRRSRVQGEGFILGDRAEAEHREGGREILRNRREEGEERRDLVVGCHRG